MEFDVLHHFKGIENLPKDPYNGDEIGAALFLTGNMGPKISEKMDGYAKTAGMSRRNFLRSSTGALPTLHDRYGISRDALADRIKRWLA